MKMKKAANSTESIIRITEKQINHYYYYYYQLGYKIQYKYNKVDEYKIAVVVVRVAKLYTQ